MIQIAHLPRLTLTLQRQLRCVKWICQVHQRKHYCYMKNASVLPSQKLSRSCTTEAILHPPGPGEDKQYPDKIKRLVEDISRLTLIEVSDLNDLLKKTLNIQDIPAMPFGMMPMMGQPAEAAEEAEEDTQPKTKSSFTVKLTKFDETKKIALIKEMKTIMDGMNLVQAKKFVESTPQIVRADIGKDEAEKLKAAIEAAGGSCEIE